MRQIGGDSVAIFIITDYLEQDPPDYRGAYNAHLTFRKWAPK